jgi:hypothetical protein
LTEQFSGGKVRVAQALHIVFPGFSWGILSRQQKPNDYNEIVMMNSPEPQNVAKNGNKKCHKFGNWAPNEVLSNEKR